MKKGRKEPWVVLLIFLLIEVGLAATFVVQYLTNRVVLKLTSEQLIICGLSLGVIYVFYVELRQRRLSESLVGEKVRTHTLISALPYPVVVLDPDGDIVAVNGGACNLLGADPILCLGTPFVSLVDEQAGRQLEQTPSGQILAITKTGARRLRLDILALGKTRGRVISLEDVDRETKVVRSAPASPLGAPSKAMLSALWDRLARLTEDVEKFNGGKRAALAEALVLARRLVNHGEDVNAVPSRAVKEPGDVGEVAHGAVTQLSGLARARGVKLTLEKEGETTAALSQMWLTRAVEEGLLNALSYTAEGGDVKIRLQGTDSEVVVLIEDNGLGLKGEELSRAFEPGFVGSRQLPETKGGRGIGLAMVRRIVEGHGGSVLLESRPDQGTRLTLRIPKA